MDFQYIPILKNRREELNVLKILFQLPISSKVLPLIEVVQERTQKNYKTVFYEDLIKFLDSEIPYMVEVQKCTKPVGTKPEVKQFLTRVKRDLTYQISLFKELSVNSNLIPVISYDPDDYVPNEIINTSQELRKIGYKRIAYRLNHRYFSEPLGEISSEITDGDILIYDLGNLRYSNQDFIYNYGKVNELKVSKKVKTAIVHSVIKKEITNIGLTNGKKIDNLNDGLREYYKSYGFDAFGDYACIKGELPPSGGTISPGFIFYSWKQDCYYGFNGREPKLTEFKDYIVPNVLKSDCWNEYLDSHRDKCPGCLKILDVNNGLDDGKNQSLWKRISMLHYIHTMDEFL